MYTVEFIDGKNGDKTTLSASFEMGPLYFRVVQIKTIWSKDPDGYWSILYRWTTEKFRYGVAYCDEDARSEVMEWLGDEIRTIFSTIGDTPF